MCQKSKQTQKLIAAVVVLHNPPKSVLQNVETYRSEVEVLYIVDNSPDLCRELVDTVKRLDKVTYLTAGKNVGIAAALNIAARKALEEGYDYLLTMDQDSAASDGMISILYGNFVQNSAIGLVTPFHQDRNAPLPMPEQEVERVTTAMTSGNLLFLGAYMTVGGFMEKLFIDYVDVEYCLRLQVHGFSIVRANRAILFHSLGHFTPKKFFGMIVHPTNHSPSRRYYQTRNRIYVRYLYGDKFPSYFKRDKKYLWGTIVKIILYEEQKFQQLVMIFRGYLAFLRRDFSTIPML